ncbi:hypothetical protein L596_030029 [Steinernema carpocapsae]|uniref:Uncharacterized protein n=1 Tax=Steinernema carpocapsae TaxID=34508 RepID=A0A4V5ZX84_STECR|nr:hypothetical protein L596_030029 [Steinernema carpocapsae]
MGTQPATRGELRPLLTDFGALGRIRRGMSYASCRAQIRPETRQHGREISVYSGFTRTQNLRRAGPATNMRFDRRSTIEINWALPA